jgi:nicotinamide-nucleotide amidase
MNIFHHAQRVGSLLKRVGYTLSTCESCTGGMLGGLITSVAGSSEYFLGGVIAYANDIKMRVVGVRKDILKRYGAVSKTTAREMARGTRERFRSDIAVSITGIAGPSGGTRKKPVGRVYICVATRERTVLRSHLFHGTRKIIREKACLSALHQLEILLSRIPGSTGVK